MRYLSVCSGIEAATVAWHPLGWQAAAFSEIEAFPRAVLAHHYPDVPCHGDFTTIGADDYGPVDLLVGGTPCQSFSIAGLRGGLADERGNLALEYLRLADRKRPRWLVWENVPGVLSSNGGRDFGSILGGMAELGYGTAYRVLDAQHFGIPQRRRRVFAVGYLGDWRRAAAVLFERHSLSGHPAPRREARERVAGCLSPGAHPGGFNGQDAYTDHLIAHALRAEGFDASEDGTGRGTPLVPVAIQAGALRENPESGPDGVGVRDDGLAYTLEARAEVQAICFSAKDHGADAMHDLSPTLRAGGHSRSHANAGVMPAVAFSIMPMNSGKDYVARETDVAQPIMAGGPVGGNQGGDFIVPIDMRQASRGATMTNNRAGVSSGGAPGTGIGEPGDPSPTVAASHVPAIAGSAVRRLTPRECERLQGFPDDYTLIPYRGKAAADGPRYKALGNSFAVPVVRWIGERIARVDALSTGRIAA